MSGGSYFGSAIAHEFTTDSDGRFAWKEAPGERGSRRLSPPLASLASKNRALASDTDQDIVLSRPTTVKGTVVDRETGQPLERFSLTLAAALEAGRPSHLAARVEL